MDMFWCQQFFMLTKNMERLLWLTNQTCWESPLCKKETFIKVTLLLALIFVGICLKGKKFGSIFMIKLFRNLSF